MFSLKIAQTKILTHFPPLPLCGFLKTIDLSERVWYSLQAWVICLPSLKHSSLLTSCLKSWESNLKSYKIEKWAKRKVSGKKKKSLTSSPTIFNLQCIFSSTFSKDFFDNKNTKPSYKLRILRIIYQRNSITIHRCITSKTVFEAQLLRKPIYLNSY